LEIEFSKAGNDISRLVTLSEPAIPRNQPLKFSVAVRLKRVALSDATSEKKWARINQCDQRRVRSRFRSPYCGLQRCPQHRRYQQNAVAFEHIAQGSGADAVELRGLANNYGSMVLGPDSIFRGHVLLLTIRSLPPHQGAENYHRLSAIV
jgi:hypothetical protein